MAKVSLLHIEPKTRTFSQAIMDGYANEQRPEKVGEILKEAQAAGVEPNLETFIILLKTFAFVGDAKGAWETYRALRSAG